MKTTESPLKIPQMEGAETGRRTWKRLLILIGIPLLAVILILWFKNGDNDKITYKTQAARKGDLTLTVVATGNLEPTNQVDVGSELSGIIETVEVDYNDPVRKGQVLARLDTTRLDAEVLQAKAALSAARANLLQARATLEETQIQFDRVSQAAKLSSGKAVSQSDVDTAKASVDRAVASEASSKAAVSQAQATLDAILTDLSKTEILSPINGVVLTRSVEPGQTVAASLSAPVLFTLAEDLTQMALHVDVDEADVGKVKEGQSAVFSVDAYPNEKFLAKVVQVRYGPSTTEGVVTYETVMKVDNKNLMLLPGMTATAEITVEKITNALLLSNAALRFIPPISQGSIKKSRRGGIVGRLFPHPRHRNPSKPDNNGMKNQQRVYILRGNNPFPVDISIGASNGMETVITGGEVKDGDLMITDSSSVPS